MVQMGVAVNVACLPTLRPLFHGISPDNIISSIRSRMSLNSVLSKTPSSSYKGSNKPRSSSAESLREFTGKDRYARQGSGQGSGDAYIQTFAVCRMDNKRSDDETPSTGILVNNRISHSVEQV